MKREIIESLKKVIDPEIFLNIVDLGLIYNISISDDKTVSVDMSLTTPGCPLKDFFISEVETVLMDLDFIEDVNINFVWSPKWELSMINESAKQNLFNGMRK